MPQVLQRAIDTTMDTLMPSIKQECWRGLDERFLPARLTSPSTSLSPLVPLYARHRARTSAAATPRRRWAHWPLQRLRRLRAFLLHALLAARPLGVAARARADVVGAAGGGRAAVGRRRGVVAAALPRRRPPRRVPALHVHRRAARLAIPHARRRRRAQRLLARVPLLGRRRARGARRRLRRRRRRRRERRRRWLHRAVAAAVGVGRRVVGGAGVGGVPRVRAAAALEQEGAARAGRAPARASRSPRASPSPPAASRCPPATPAPRRRRRHRRRRRRRRRRRARRRRARRRHRAPPRRRPAAARRLDLALALLAVGLAVLGWFALPRAALAPSLYWLRTAHALAGGPYLLFKIPLLETLLTNARPTGYDAFGHTLPKKERKGDAHTD